MSKISKISVVIPCYNEENTISQVIIKVEKSLLNLNIDYEIIVVDDHSSDDSSNKLIEFENQKKIKLFTHSQNFGKGAAIATGLKNISGEIILIQDADLEYDPTDYERLVEPIKKDFADVVFGSRFVGSEEKRVLFYWHSLGNKVLTLFSNMLTNLNLTDMENCYKVFRANVIKEIELQENRFGFEPEVTAKISKKNLRIYEVGVKYYGRKYSEGKKITWKDGISAIRCIIQYNLFGK